MCRDSLIDEIHVKYIKWQGNNKSLFSLSEEMFVIACIETRFSI